MPAPQFKAGLKAQYYHPMYGWVVHEKLYKTVERALAVRDRYIRQLDYCGYIIDVRVNVYIY